MGVGKVGGTFALTSAALTVEDGGEPDGRVTAVIDATSVHTGNDQRDRHLRSADFLDVEAYPTIEFPSTEVRDFDGEAFTLVGELAVHRVTRTVQLEGVFLGVVDRPVRRATHGVLGDHHHQPRRVRCRHRTRFGAGDVVVADTIEITIAVEFTSGGSESR